MIVNPVTVNLPRHELEILLQAARHREHRMSQKAPGRHALENAIEHCEMALESHDAIRARGRYFRAFWEENKNLLWKEANDSFNLILADRGEAYFAAAYEAKIEAHDRAEYERDQQT